MSKLYILQQCLLRKEIDMMVDISSSSPPKEINQEPLKYTQYAIDAPIPEVEVKYKNLLNAFGVTDIKELKFETIKAHLETESYIRPHKSTDIDDDVKFVFITKVEESKDIDQGLFNIFSEDGYRGQPTIEKGYTIGFAGNTRYEITRLLNGKADYIITLVK